MKTASGVMNRRLGTRPIGAEPAKKGGGAYFENTGLAYRFA